MDRGEIRVNEFCVRRIPAGTRHRRSASTTPPCLLMGGCFRSNMTGRLSWLSDDVITPAVGTPECAQVVVASPLA